MPAGPQLVHEALTIRQERASLSIERVAKANFADKAARCRRLAEAV